MVIPEIVVNNARKGRVKLNFICFNWRGRIWKIRLRTRENHSSCSSINSERTPPHSVYSFYRKYCKRIITASSLSLKHWKIKSASSPWPETWKIWRDRTGYSRYKKVIVESQTRKGEELKVNERSRMLSLPSRDESTSRNLYQMLKII